MRFFSVEIPSIYKRHGRVRRVHNLVFAPPGTGKGFEGTLEFFPEEGKYHLDGHRKCKICLEPRETKKYRGLCPTCGKFLTVGVLSRVEELADRKPGEELDLKVLSDQGREMLALGLDRMRKGRVIREAGYDGEFGRIRLFKKGEIKR